MMSPRECFVLYCKTVEHRSRMSRDLLQTGEFTVTHFCFVVTAFSVIACVLLHACSFVSQPSLCTAQGRIILILDVVSEKHSILARSVFVLHGHRDIAVVLIASIAISIPDILLYFTVRLETGDSQDLKCGVFRITPLPSPSTTSHVGHRRPDCPRRNESCSLCGKLGHLSHSHGGQKGEHRASHGGDGEECDGCNGKEGCIELL